MFGFCKGTYINYKVTKIYFLIERKIYAFWEEINKIILKLESKNEKSKVMKSVKISEFKLWKIKVENIFQIIKETFLKFSKQVIFLVMKGKIL